MRKHLLERKRLPMQVRMGNGEGAKQFVELRSAQVGVSVLDHDTAGMFIALKMEVPAFTIEDPTVNGCVIEMTAAQANHLIEVIERGVRLMGRHEKQAEKADTDARYK